MPTLLAALVLLAALAEPPERQQEGGNIMGPYVGRKTTEGPATICGSGFAIRLDAGESVARQEGPDFDLFYVTAADGHFLLYEGGHPQPHDDEISTGEHSLIAIHDNRPADAERAGLEATDVPPAAHLAPDESCPLEPLQVLRHAREAHVEGRRQLADRGRPAPEPGENLTARGIGQRGEGAVQRRA